MVFVGQALTLGGRRSGPRDHGLQVLALKSPVSIMGMVEVGTCHQCVTVVCPPIWVPREKQLHESLPRQPGGVVFVFGLQPGFNPRAVGRLSGGHQLRTW